MSEGGGTDGAADAARLLLALPSAVLIYNSADQVVLANPAAQHMFSPQSETPLAGLSLEAIASLASYKGLYGAGDPKAQVMAAMEIDRRQHHCRVLRTTDGRFLEVRSIPLPGGGWASVTQDVTPHRQAEASSRQRMRLMDMALRKNPSGVAIYDAERRLVLYNDQYEAMLEVPAGSIHIGMDFDTVTSLVIDNTPLDDEQRALFESRRHVDRRQRGQFLRQRGDGSALRVTSQPLDDGGFLVVQEDVTPLRAAEDEANRRAALLDAVLEAMPQGVCVYGPDRRLRMANAAFRGMVGASEVRIGEHLRDILRRREAASEYTRGEDPEVVYRRQFDFGRDPVLRRRADGKLLSGNTAPLPDGGHISVLGDVTALHAAEEEAKRRADLLQLIMDSMRHGVCLFDREHRVVVANTLAYEMTGLSRQELAPGARLEDLRRIQLERGQFGNGLRAEQIFQSRSTHDPALLETFTRTRADGRVIETATDPTPDGGFVRIYTDVTAEHTALAAIEQARRAAEQADFSKTRFLATMSHELRTPLNAVIGFSEALLAEGAAERDPLQVAEFAGTILEAGRHLLSLIDEVLAVAQAGAGALRVETRPLYIPSVLDSTLRLMRTTADAAGVELVLEALPDLPRAHADERRLRQILLNLLANSVKFTPAGGQVRLSAAAISPGLLEITVTDTGIGMAPDQLERAFEPFVQLETSHARRYGGSGLGLYLARALAGAMDATLTLESERGGGTVARLRLATAMQAQEQTA
ncbi:PAS-domain containing protein [Pseudoroseomonas globiformis]|uniref:histidine kinase n=1 Tax=Teichococcus globiformis TaxID=2307229 RepID=A0ABV7FV68_9PROT